MLPRFHTSKRKRNTFVSKVAPYRSIGSGTSSKEKSSGWRALRLDKRLVFITLVFVITGLLFTYSSSAFDSSSFFKRQLIFDILGLSVAAFGKKALMNCTMSG